MKKIFLAVLILILSTASFAQYKSQFTGTTGTVLTSLASPDSFTSVKDTAYGAGTTNGSFQIINNTITPTNAAGNGKYAFNGWRTKVLGDSVKIQLKITQLFTVNPSSPLRDFQLLLLSDTSMRGHGAWATLSRSTATTAWFDCGYYSGASAVNPYEQFVGGTSLVSVAIGDSFALVMKGDSVEGWKNGVKIIGGRDSRASNTLAYGVFGAIVQNTPVQLDNLVISRLSAAAPPAPVVRDTVGVRGTLTYSPTLLDTSKTISFTGAFTDNFGCKKAWLYVDSAGTRSSFVLKDSVTLTGTSISKAFAYTKKYSTAGYRYAYMKMQDDTLNVTYSDTVSMYVSLPSSGGGQIGWVTGYYPIWSYCSMKPNAVDWSALTHVIIFSADPDPTTAPYFSPVTKAADSSSLEWGVPTPNCAPSSNGSGVPAGYSYYQWMNDSADAHGVKLLLCLGGIYGTGASNMAQIAADSTKTELWAQSAVAYITRKHLDGVDLDWEFPGVRNDFIRALRILRRNLNTMNPPGLLTIAGGDDEGIYTYAEIGSYVDQVNIMSYDMSGGSWAWFNSPISVDPTIAPATLGSCGTGTTSWKTYGWCRYVAQSWPKSKLSMGIPFYGYYFSGASAPGQNKSGNSYITYDQAINVVRSNQSSWHWNDSARAPWVGFNGTYNGVSGNHYFTFEDTNSVKLKAQYIKDVGLGGAMIYELVAGYVSSANAVNGRRDPLLQAVKSVVGGASPSVIPSTPTLSTPSADTVGVDVNARVLSWGASSNASTYTVQLATSNAFSPASIVYTVSGVLTTTYTDVQRLGNGTVYYWRVSAQNSSGASSSYSTARAFTTKALSVTTPGLVTLVSPTANQSNVSLTPTLYWNRKDTVTAYKLQVVPNDSTSTAYVVNNPGWTDTSYFIGGGLFNSTNYYWRVAAVNVTTTGSYSAWRRFSTLPVSSNPPVSTSGRQEHRVVTSQIVRGVYKSDVGLQSIMTSRNMQSKSELIPPYTSGNINWGWVNGSLVAVTYDSVYHEVIPTVSATGDLTVNGILGVSGSIYGAGLTLTGDATLNGETATNGTLFVNQGAELSGLISFANGHTISGLHKLDTLYRTAGKDSIFFKINGVTYAIRDSVGTGGGSAPNGKAIMDSINNVNVPSDLSIKNKIRFLNATGAANSDSGYAQFYFDGALGGDISASSGSFNLNANVSQMAFGTPATYGYAKANGFEFGRIGGDTTEWAGVVGIVDTINRTGQTTSISPFSMAHINHATNADGLYEVSYYCHTTTASGAGTPTAKLLFAYNDGASRTDSTSTWALSATDGTGILRGSYVFWRDSGTPTIGVSVLGAAGSPVYSIHVAVKKLSQ